MAELSSVGGLLIDVVAPVVDIISGIFTLLSLA